jgi:agmatinase
VYHTWALTVNIVKSMSLTSPTTSFMMVRSSLGCEETNMSRFSDIAMHEGDLGHLPHSAGPASFCRARMVDDLGRLPGDARIAFLGIPFDGGTVYRPGSRFGPRGIRQASIVYASSSRGFGGFYDVEVGRVLLAKTRMVDVGDVHIPTTRSDRSAVGITSTVGDLIDRGLFVVSAGGDHSVSFPIIRAHADRGRINVVQFDTHLDFTDEVSGDRHTQGSCMRRASELEGVASITQIGIRGLLNSPVSHVSAKAAGNVIVTTQELRARGADQTIALVPPGDCYVTIDIDLFDPSVAPGTGTPEPGGLSYDEIKALLAALAGRRDVTIGGFDLVEVNPLLDHNGITALLASRVILDFLGMIWDKKEEKELP